ncbi:hypothetical protein Mal64_37010 [Pseudobythopirellula maris]|uniref:Uncharacterized protein n=2 Tax=Pseudobythopirellula maris TaxID=2527991 RepID=A0A5C5ZJ78_9BACT|nr:hypothetical protein Mal64_37010 [Pseudobythopirellula maris]
MNILRIWLPFAWRWHWLVAGLFAVMVVLLGGLRSSSGSKNDWRLIFGAAAYFHVVIVRRNQIGFYRKGVAYAGRFAHWAAADWRLEESSLGTRLVPHFLSRDGAVPPPLAGWPLVPEDALPQVRTILAEKQGEEDE